MKVNTPWIAFTIPEDATKSTKWAEANLTGAAIQKEKDAAIKKHIEEGNEMICHTPHENCKLIKKGEKALMTNLSRPNIITVDNVEYYLYRELDIIVVLDADK